jgi:hypothetical protein
MANICDNPRCTYHRPLPARDAGAPYVDTYDDGQQIVRVTRYLYQSHDGRREFFLCDVCHDAVEMVLAQNTM